MHQVLFILFQIRLFSGGNIKLMHHPSFFFIQLSSIRFLSTFHIFANICQLLFSLSVTQQHNLYCILISLIPSIPKLQDLLINYRICALDILVLIPFFLSWFLHLSPSPVLSIFCPSILSASWCFTNVFQPFLSLRIIYVSLLC